MEILTLILQRRFRTSESFKYHKHYEELRIINVCFADDLFIFAHGDVDSAGVIMASLDEFRKVSGLVPSIPKSKLPVNYLGVPLISSLIASMQVYWASVLVIPMGIVYDIQQVIRGFLWCNGEYKRGKAKVAWIDICLPKKEGRLGLHSLELLQLREHVKPFFWSCIGNGMNTSLWYDMWSTRCPLNRFLTPIDIAREGYSIQTRVADLLVNGAWNWPLSCLKTQDKLRQWDVAPTTDITQNIVGKILFAAALYFIWLERINRLFKNNRRTPEELRDAIVVTVRLKLTTFRFKNKAKVHSLLSLWKMPTSFRFYG
ncbi:hypothetical protein Tco_0242510 [Tanacetum coccineum]